jgi:hypothetical protein
MLKVDLSDGFYRIWLRPSDVPVLGVAFSALPDGLPISPPYGLAGVNLTPIFVPHLDRHRPHQPTDRRPLGRPTTAPIGRSSIHSARTPA